MIRKLLIPIVGSALILLSGGSILRSAAATEPTDVGTSLPRLSCVGCDGCNGAGGNHITFNGGGRDGVRHDCFDGSTCSVHNYNSSCGGELTDEQAFQEFNAAKAISWDDLSKLDGDSLADQLRTSKGRWTLRADSGTMLWSDCFGNIVASIPVDAEKLQIARAVSEEVAAVQ